MNESLRLSPEIVDTAVAEHVATRAYGPVYGEDWIYHDDRLGFLPSKPVMSMDEALELEDDWRYRAGHHDGWIAGYPQGHADHRQLTRWDVPIAYALGLAIGAFVALLAARTFGVVG